jgi:hypothetical protein
MSTKDSKPEQPCTLHSVISRFLFDQSDGLKMQCNEISVSIDPCHEDDRYVDLVIYDDHWNELKRIKTLNGL